MAMSSSTATLFSAVAITIIGAGGAAYVLKNKDDVKGFVKFIAKPRTALQAVDRAKSDSTSRSGPSDDQATAVQDAGDVTLKAGDSGHFETEAEVNGRGIEVMVDTGATMVALTYEDAQRAGIFLTNADFTGSVSTANGKSKIAPIQISSISIGGITVRNVQGAVTEPGKLHRTLLGMSFLGRLSRVDMRSKTLVLHE